MAVALRQHQIVTCMHKHYALDEWLSFAAQHPDVLPFVAASCGSSDSDFTMLQSILQAIPQIKFVCLDVANGYSEAFLDAVKRVRHCFPSHIVCAGNVVTGEMVEELLLSGADCIKIGIGPGSVCTTRRQTGVGYPQLSAVIECADAAHGLGGHIISDGGCTCPGDFGKAFGAGADFVMVGGMLAGHDESGGELIEEGGRFYKDFYGGKLRRAPLSACGGPPRLAEGSQAS